MAQRSNLDSRKKENKLLTRTRGDYKLQNVYDQLILVTPKIATPPTYKEALMSGLRCQSDEDARVAVKRHFKNVSNMHRHNFFMDLTVRTIYYLSTMIQMY